MAYAILVPICDRSSCTTTLLIAILAHHFDTARSDDGVGAMQGCSNNNLKEMLWSVLTSFTPLKFCCPIRLDQCMLGWVVVQGKTSNIDCKRNSTITIASHSDQPKHTFCYYTPVQLVRVEAHDAQDSALSAGLDYFNPHASVRFKAGVEVGKASQNHRLYNTLRKREPRVHGTPKQAGTNIKEC